MAAGELAAAAPGPAAPAEAAGSRPEASLRRKVTWITFFRLVMVTVLLGGTAATSWKSGQEFEGAAGPLYALIAGTYLASLAVAVALRRSRGLSLLAYAQVVLDAGIAAVVVALTGYSESVFVFLFTLGVVNGGILLYRRGALVAAAVALGVYLALVLGFEPAGPARLSRLFVHGSAFLATAALAGYLAEQLRRTGERLEARELDLAAITALHEAIVQSVASGLVTIAAGGRVTFLNRAGEQITGLSAAEVTGQPAARWFAALRSQRGRDETDFVDAGGVRRRLGYTAFPLRGGEDGGLGTAIIFQDLTELRAMEDAVRRSERLADLGRFSAGLAHELRNPLASMSGCVELLRSSPSLGGEERRLMDIVLREATRLDQLVTRFLEYARPAEPRRKRIDLGELASETLEVFGRDPAAARVRLEREIAPARVECDPDQMRQVLWNLLANAAQAVAGRDGGGRIRVTCRPEPHGGARLAVEDDGAGISPADLPRVFTPFFTTRREGTGLGLATVQRIVDAHGGVVTAESAPGRGTVFGVRLPGTEEGSAARGEGG